MNLDTASLAFIGFGLIAAVLMNVRQDRRWRFGVLLATSLLFIGLLAKDARSLVPLVGFLGLGYVGLWLIAKGVPRMVGLSIVAVIVVYMWLKKYTFLPEGSFITFSYLTIGLSYIFFRVLHLLIVSGDPERPRVSLGDYLLYTLNFTTLVSGPIQRFDDFGRDVLPMDAAVMARQLERIVIGFFKVNVAGLLLHGVQQDALLELAHPTPLPTKLFAAFRLAVVYPFFLYCNFSGYIDIVIALARLMRLELPENFDRPFSATSFLDFWNRWHITLSSWLKSYVYNSLLMVLMRRIKSPPLLPYLGVLCFFVTFFLVGVWHGRTSEFVVFGLLQGGGVAINKLWQLQLAKRLGTKRYRALTKEPLYVAFARGLTFSWFAFTLFWFWATWQQIDAAFGALPPADWLSVWFAVWVVASAVLAMWEWLRVQLLSFTVEGTPIITHRYTRMVCASVVGLLAFAITVMLNQAAPDIVYKAF